MLLRLSRSAVALIGALALTVHAGASDAGSTSDAARTLSKRFAEITRIDGGFHYLASKHQSNLTITRDGGRVVFHDEGMRRFREALPRGCRNVRVMVGIAASCRIPATATDVNPLILEIAPQAGSDRVDGSALGAEFQLIVEAAGGDDVVIGGAGDDELNGGLGVDQMTGGSGDDWIRVGPGADIGDGGVGADRVVGTDGPDHLSGGEGPDLLEGGTGNDELLGGPGSDVLLCGTGHDSADDHEVEDDTSRHCEIFIP